MRHSATRGVALITLIAGLGFALETSRYMGGPVELVEAPNGAIVNADILEKSSAGMLGRVL